MSKKFIFFASILLIAGFSSGIFTEIVVSSQDLQLPSHLPGTVSVILDYLRDDFLTVLAALFCALSVFLTPLIPLLFLGKTFSLGYSAAYLLSANAENTRGILLAVLALRGICKIPVYLALVILAFETAGFVKNNYHSLPALKRGLSRRLIRFLLCFGLLSISSVPEAILLQIVL